jgi:hypothetical protein
MRFSMAELPGAGALGASAPKSRAAQDLFCGLGCLP